jgi:peptide/nickel transport system substrate-binding protein
MDLPFPAYQIKPAVAPKKPGYSVRAAEALLQKAGWKKAANGARMKKKTPLTLRLVTVKDPQYEKIAANLVSQWGRLGIDVQTTVFDPSTTNQSFAQAVLQPRQYDVLLNELVIGADADVYAY